MSEPIADQINPQSWSINSSDKAEQLLINIWGGKMGLCIFANKSKVWNQTCSNDLLIILKKSLVGILTAQPETRRAISISAWNQEEKKAVPSCSIIIGKNEKKVIYIEVQFKDRGNPKSIRFELFSSFLLSVGTESMTDEERSILRTEGIIDYITNYFPVASVITSKKYKPPTSNSGGNKSSGFGNDAPNF